MIPDEGVRAHVRIHIADPLLRDGQGDIRLEVGRNRFSRIHDDADASVAFAISLYAPISPF